MWEGGRKRKRGERDSKRGVKRKEELVWGWRSERKSEGGLESEGSGSGSKRETLREEEEEEEEEEDRLRVMKCVQNR